MFETSGIILLVIVVTVAIFIFSLLVKILPRWFVKGVGYLLLGAVLLIVGITYLKDGKSDSRPTTTMVEESDSSRYIKNNLGPLIAIVIGCISLGGGAYKLYMKNE